MPKPPTGKTPRNEFDSTKLVAESTHKTKKKIYSKPLDTAIEETSKPQIEDLVAAAKSAEPALSVTNPVTLDEDQRKRLRINRLRQQNATNEFNIGVLKDADASREQKQETLDKITLMRELKKQIMLRNTVN